MADIMSRSVTLRRFFRRMPARTAGLLALALAIITGAPSAAAAQPSNASAADGLHVTQLQPDFYVIAGAGANIAVQIGEDGVVVVDTGLEAHAEAVLAEIRRLTDRPIRYIVNTSADPDHVGGNEVLSGAGQSIVPTGGLNDIAAYGGRAPIAAEENVLARMSAPHGQEAPYPSGAWPTSTYAAALGETQKDVYINGQALQLFHQPAAHSDADSIVMFRRNDVIAVGDVLDTTRFPVINLEQGGSVQGVIDSLNRIIQLTVAPTPMIWQQGGTVVIPGHGRICHESEVVDYRDMLTIIRDRVQSLIDRGMTLAQVQQANPTAGYTARYGADSGPWTTNTFVEAVYRDLSDRATGR